MSGMSTKVIPRLESLPGNVQREEKENNPGDLKVLIVKDSKRRSANAGIVHEVLISLKAEVRVP